MTRSRTANPPAILHVHQMANEERQDRVPNTSSTQPIRFVDIRTRHTVSSTAATIRSLGTFRFAFTIIAMKRIYLLQALFHGYARLQTTRAKPSTLLLRHRAFPLRHRETSHLSRTGPHPRFHVAHTQTTSNPPMNPKATGQTRDERSGTLP